MKIADIKVEYVGHYGTDLTTVDSARVSFDKVSEWARYGCNDCQNAVETACQDNCACVAAGAKGHQTLKPEDVKLINYLAKHKHRSPFNHSFVSVRVKAPIFVARQLV